MDEETAQLCCKVQKADPWARVAQTHFGRHGNRGSWSAYATDLLIFPCNNTRCSSIVISQPKGKL